MADNQRIEDLRRRVQKDPASIAFAQLAEEYRRAGHFKEAVDVCRAGLEIHPGYLSARVTLGRALIELDQRDDAMRELEFVLASAPENLAALRGVAEILHHGGKLAEALARYRAALALARNDPDLEQTVKDLAKLVEPPVPTASSTGLSLEQMQDEFLRNVPPAPPRPRPQKPIAPVAAAAPAHTPTPADASLPTDAPAPTDASVSTDAPALADASAPDEASASADTSALAEAPASVDATTLADPAAEADAPAPADATEPSVVQSSQPEAPVPAERDHHSLAVLEALEQFLGAVHVARAQRYA
jgi:tetratricopeptide (TPR) repeat protein